MGDILSYMMGMVDIIGGMAIAIGLGGFWIILSFILIFKGVISFL